MNLICQTFLLRSWLMAPLLRSHFHLRARHLHISAVSAKLLAPVCVCVCVIQPPNVFVAVSFQVCVVTPGLPDADVQTLPPAGQHRQTARA